MCFNFKVVFQIAVSSVWVVSYVTRYVTYGMSRLCRGNYVSRLCRAQYRDEPIRTPSFFVLSSITSFVVRWLSKHEK